MKIRLNSTSVFERYLITYCLILPCVLMCVVALGCLCCISSSFTSRVIRSNHVVIHSVVLSMICHCMQVKCPARKDKVKISNTVVDFLDQEAFVFPER